MSDDDHGDPVVVAEYATEFEAALVANRLREEGIRSIVEGQLTAGFRAEAPGRVRLLVRGADAARARELLAEDAGPEE